MIIEYEPKVTHGVDTIMTIGDDEDPMGLKTSDVMGAAIFTSALGYLGATLLAPKHAQMAATVGFLFGYLKPNWWVA